MAQKSSENGQSQPEIPPLDADELYRRYLRIRAKGDLSKKNTDDPIIE